ncbi:FAD/FMN-containing dehydrogenase [Roseateles sp. YR242]|uniref:FAD-binding oxidoreductase n=1 Tax=Roseateles sp. YR242 TaxID=1855305 RepID=UPI0008D3C927|nr:FAD-binding oxidoreductase [Roseateles sp. YR242]SEK20714.1 FAD/FMN-containing dehydrogenase [Roseateles sp. YR242]
MSSTVIDSLRELLGSEHVLLPGALPPQDLAGYHQDWRKRYNGRALAILRPADTAQVAAVVRLAREHRISLVPQGGNTGLVGGGVPDPSGTQLLLSLRRLQQVRRLDAANHTITVEAGCILQQVQEAAQQAGLLFPLSLAAEGSCTIGGNLSTNAGGTQVLRYGNARELCLGLEVVTAEGEIWDGLSGLRKDNTGYDLRDLFIGAEGTLGVITAATLKLYPQPRARMTALAACDSLQDAVDLLNLTQSRCGAALTGFEVMNALSLALVARHFPQLPQPLGPRPWTVLLELSDSEGEAHAREQFESVLEQALERGLINDAAVAETLAQSQAMWHLRESIPLAQSEQGLNIKHDIALPVSRIPGFVASCDALLARQFPGAGLVNFGHLGDGNLHYNLQAPPGVAPAEFLREHEHAVNALVYDQVGTHGGSISAEHGIGQLKRDELAQRKSPVALQLMRQIKQALDPLGLLNPNRVV